MDSDVTLELVTDEKEVKQFNEILSKLFYEIGDVMNQSFEKIPDDMKATVITSFFSRGLVRTIIQLDVSKEDRKRILETCILAIRKNYDEVKDS